MQLLFKIPGKRMVVAHFQVDLVDPFQAPCVVHLKLVVCIEADKGNENSRIAKHSGLLYHVLDEKGNRVGVPIKASRFYDKPTLNNLEKKFATNEIKGQPNKSRIKNAIDTIFLRNNIIILPQLVKQLQKEGIDTILRQNAEGLVYGITFVDHKSRTVLMEVVLEKNIVRRGYMNGVP